MSQFSPTLRDEAGETQFNEIAGTGLRCKQSIKEGGQTGCVASSALVEIKRISSVSTPKRDRFN